MSGQRVPTAPKGKPTPKRSEASRRRGPVAPAPLTSAEARRRRKETAGPKLSREEKKAERTQRKAEMSQRREKMMAGEAAYLLPRDQGPVRRYARDVVDSRRNLLGLFMPSALGLIFVMLAVPSVQVQRLLSPAMLVLVLIMVIDGFILGRKVNRLADREVPGQHRIRLEARLLRRQPGLATAPHARAAASGRTRRQRRVTSSVTYFPAIPTPDAEAAAAARERQTRLTKPLGALGRLEDLSVWVAGCQGALSPKAIRAGAGGGVRRRSRRGRRRRVRISRRGDRRDGGELRGGRRRGERARRLGGRRRAGRGHRRRHGRAAVARRSARTRSAAPAATSPWRTR